MVNYMYEIKDRIPNFDLYPLKDISGIQGWKGTASLVCELKTRLSKLNQPRKVVCIDYYHGVKESVVEEEIVKALNPTLVIHSEEAKLSETIIAKKFGQFITEDRINGVFSIATIEEFFDLDKLEELKEEIETSHGLVVIYGVGASLITKGDITIYGSISYQTIKDRYQEGLDNWGAKNFDEDYLRKEKRFNFLESRVLDRHKRDLLKESDYIIDCNRNDDFMMITQKDYDKIVDTNGLPILPLKK